MSSPKIMQGRRWRLAFFVVVLCIASTISAFAGVNVSSPVHGRTSVYTTGANVVGISMPLVSETRTVTQPRNSSGAAYTPPSPINVAGTPPTTSVPAPPPPISVAAPAAPAQAGPVFYVAPGGNDANDGSAARPFATLNKAASVAGPGYTVHVAPGTYYGQVRTSRSGTPAARIRFVADVRWLSQLRTTGGTVWMNSGDYVDIVGFDIQGPGQNGIENTASNVRVISNRVHDIPVPNGPDGGAGIVHSNYSAVDNETVGNVVQNIGVGKANSAVHGIYHANLRGRVVNNIVFLADGWGIHLWHAANQVTISNNTVFNNLNGGIVVGDGDGPGGVMDDNCIVTNNISVFNGGYGLQEYGRTGAHNVFWHNVSYGNRAGNVHLQTSADSGTIQLDPQFVNYQANGTGDYHLLPTSPALDGGTDYGAPTNDIDGGARPLAGNWDIGAFETGSGSTTWPWN